MDFGVAQSLAYFAPELALFAAVSVVAVLERLACSRQAGEIAILGAAASVYFASRLVGWGEGWIFGGLLVVDPLSVFFRILFGVTAMVVIWISIESGEEARAVGRRSALVLAGALAADVAAGASSVLVAVAALEALSAAVAALVAIGAAARALRAALRFLLCGAAASATALVGASFVLGLAGTTAGARIAESLVAMPDARLALSLGAALIVAAFAARASTAPLHAWTTEAIAAAPAPVGAFVAACATTAALAATARFAASVSRLGAAGPGSSPAALALLVASVASMTFGNLAALWARSWRRLLADVTIAQAGSALMGVALGEETALRAALFGIAAHVVAVLGAFAVAATIPRSAPDVGHRDARALAWRGGLAAALAMTVFLASLAGVPPFVGYAAKVRLFDGAAEAGFAPLGWLVVANQAVGAVWVARATAPLFARVGADPRRRIALGGYQAVLVALLALATVALGVAPAFLDDLVGRSARLFQD